MSKSATRRINLYINGQQVRNDIASIHKEARKLTGQLAHMERGSKEYNQTAAKVKQLNGVMKEHNAGLRQTNTTLGNLKASWLAIGAAIAVAFRSIRSLMAGYDSRLKANEALLFSLNGQIAAQRRLIQLADQYQRAHGHDDDAIKTQMAFLALQGRTESQIQRTMEAAFELSKIMGTGLAESVRYLDGTFEGQLGRLNRLDEGFKELTTEQLRNGAAVDLILEKYQGLSERSFKEGLGPLNRFKNAMSDLRKTIGEIVFSGIMPLYFAAAQRVESINNALVNVMTTSNQRFSDQTQKVADLVMNIEPLAQRYDELKTKSHLSTEEQIALDAIIKTLAKNVPFAASKFDEYGNAVEFSTDRITEHIQRQKELMQYINRSAIKETEKDLAKVDKELAKIAPHIEEIEKTGTFQKLQRFFNQQTQEWVTDYRDASQTMVNETIATNQRLLAERRGIQAHLDELTGDALESEIERRRKEAEAAAKSKTGTEEVATAYETLAKQIGEARKQMEAFVSAGQFDEAKQTSQGIAALEAQKRVMDGIIKAGGDVIKFLDDLTDSEEAALQETAAFNEQFLNEFSDIFDEIAEKRQRHREEEMARDQRRREWELEEDEKRKDQKIQNEKEIAQARKEITDASLNTAFSLLDQHLYAAQTRQIYALNLRRDVELANENLTADQRQKIYEKYQQKEAQIKEQAFKRQRRADIIQSLINGYLTVSRALAAPPGWPFNATSVVTAGILAAIQTGSIAAQPVPQYAVGKYDVIGADDKRKYRARYIGKPKTGIVRNPSLVSELGPEMIIDSNTLGRLNPDIIRSIHAARHVPQYQQGHYQTKRKEDPTSTDLSFVEKFSDSVNHFSNKVDELKDLQIEAHINYQRFKEFEKKVDQSEKNQI